MIAGRPRFDRRLFLALWLLGLLGLLSLLTAPLEVMQPAGLDVTPLQFRLLSLVNPFILLTLAVAIGGFLAPRIGLDAPVVRAVLERRPVSPVLRPQLIPALLVGAGVAAMLLIYARISAAWLADAPAFAMPLLPKLLYGGITEELLTRWGLLSLFAWVAWRLGAGRGTALVVGATLAALLFAAGHLPVLYMLLPDPPAHVIAGILVGNALPGLLFGWLFAARGLEAAMLAHALAHLFATLLG